MADLPTAVIRPRRSPVWIWIMPLLAAGLSAFLVVSYHGNKGYPIVIAFEEGRGLNEGNLVKARGIVVGVVDQLDLSADMEHVVAQVHLRPSARSLARAESRFWIVRPQMDMTGPRGLETVVGDNYISVLPGEGQPTTEFRGMEEAPLLDLIEPGGTHISLIAPTASGLQRGSLLTYRQVNIGMVLDLELAATFDHVEIQAYVLPQASELVCERTVFWRTGGARVRAGLFTGLKVDLESVHSLVVGGVSLALPPEPGPRVENGHRFRLHDKPDDDWKKWTTGLEWPEGEAEDD